MSKIDTIATRLAGLFPKFAETAAREERNEAIILNAEWKSLSVLFLENNGLPVFETNEKVCK